MLNTWVIRLGQLPTNLANDDVCSYRGLFPKLIQDVVTPEADLNEVDDECCREE